MDINELELTGAPARLLAGLDASTLRHSRRVQKLAVAMGRSLGVSARELAALSLGSLLHDVGKRDVPPGILTKTTALSSSDWEEIQKHPIYGYTYAVQFVSDDQVRDIILHHHVWHDGQGGYPVSGSVLKPGRLARITTVADVIDAMTQDRPYRRALRLEDSLTFLQDRKGTQFCPTVVESVFRQVDQIRGLVGA